MEINIAKVEKEEEILNLNIVGNRVLPNCQCTELKERSQKAEVRCAELEIELRKEKDHYEVLEAKFKILEREKFALENEVRVLKMVGEGINMPENVSSEKERAIKPIVDLKKDNEAVQIVTENKVLKCHYGKARSEFEVYKDNYKCLMKKGNCYHEENGKKLENIQFSADENMHPDTSFGFRKNQKKVTDLGSVDSSCISPSKEIGDMHLPGTPSNGIFHRSSMVRKAIKQLTFKTEESPNKKLVPSLTINSKSTPVSVIDISDSDEEQTQDPIPDRQSSGNILIPTCFEPEKGKTSDSSCARNNEENLDFGEDLSFVAKTKRKRNCNVVTSESESDDEDNIIISRCFGPEKGKNSDSSCAQNNEENLDFGEDLLFVAKTRRKRTCNVVTSESESDDEDNMPISKHKRIHIEEASSDQVRPAFNSSLTASSSEDDEFSDNIVTRRHLQPLRKLRKSQYDKMSSCRPCRAKHQRHVQTNDNADDDQSVEDLSYSGGESMSNFIVHDSDVSDSGDSISKSKGGSNGDADSASSNLEDVSDGEIDFGEILSKIQRSKNNEMKWEYEADMLAAFGKDPELCMKAVCSLYRQQTSEEQMSKETMYQNNRGFSKFDAHRGSALAEFLTDGDPSGCLKKSVEELQEYDPERVEQCITLATHYSKQLFEIYKNEEDPFFP